MMPLPVTKTQFGKRGLNNNGVSIQINDHHRANQQLDFAVKEQLKCLTYVLHEIQTKSSQAMP
jgi:hypothetical protein